MTTADGKSVRVTAAHDLMLAQFGRGLGGDYPSGYDDADRPYTPAWQEQETGVDRDLVLPMYKSWR